MSEAIFTNIYKNAGWGTEGDGSGGGSTVEYTKSLRATLLSLCREYNIDTILDCPCGSGIWMTELLKTLPPNTRYIGVDIVSIALERAVKNMQDIQHTQFYLSDITKDQLPKLNPIGSLVLCRDTLQHLSFEDCKKAIINIARTGSEYVIINSYIPGNNINIANGEYYNINITASPFNLTPNMVIPENVHHNTNDPRKFLANFKGDSLCAQLQST
jgi:SAM-dependent methyltransferase